MLWKVIEVKLQEAQGSLARCSPFAEDVSFTPEVPLHSWHLFWGPKFESSPWSPAHLHKNTAPNPPPAPPYVYLDFKALNKHLLIYPEFRSAPPLHGFLLEFLLDPKTKGTAAEHFLHTTNLISSLWCQSRGLLHLVWGFPACCAHLRLVLDEEHRHCLELWFLESVAFFPVSASHLGIFSVINMTKKKKNLLHLLYLCQLSLCSFVIETRQILCF